MKPEKNWKQEKTLNSDLTYFWQRIKFEKQKRKEDLLTIDGYNGKYEI
jgi:hypothetical protein